MPLAGPPSVQGRAPHACSTQPHPPCSPPPRLLLPLQGNAAGAKADFRQVLALEPNNRQARDELARIEALEGPEGEEGLGGDAGMLGAAVQATF